MSPGWKALLAALFTLLLTTAPLHALELRLFHNNDLFVDNSINDDFYSFGGRIEIEMQTWTLRLTENGFTNRNDKFRFDETYVTLGRQLQAGEWSLWLEFGAMRVGEGFLGQGAQNTIHDWLGESRVFLPYLQEEKSRLHLAFESGRLYELGERFTLGPQLGLRTSVGFKSNALVGLRGVWHPYERVELDVTLGARFTETSFAPLEPVLHDAGPAMLAELEFPPGFILRWSFNRYGTERQHVAFGYRFTIGKSPRQDGEWRPLGDLP